MEELRRDLKLCLEENRKLSFLLGKERELSEIRRKRVKELQKENAELRKIVKISEE